MMAKTPDHIDVTVRVAVEYVTTHACPTQSVGVVPCCGRVVFELPTSDRITEDPALVTCTGRRLGQ